MLVVVGAADPPASADGGTGAGIVALTPCRAADTRLMGSPIPIGGSRGFKVTGSLVGQGGASDCGIPASAIAVLMSIIAVDPVGAGYLTLVAWPGPPPLSSTLNFVSGETLSNSALTNLCQPPAACPADILVSVSNASAHIVIDVVGYLTIP